MKRNFLKLLFSFLCSVMFFTDSIFYAAEDVKNEWTEITVGTFFHDQFTTEGVSDRSDSLENTVELDMAEILQELKDGSGTLSEKPSLNQSTSALGERISGLASSFATTVGFVTSIAFDVATRIVEPYVTEYQDPAEALARRMREATAFNNPLPKQSLEELLKAPYAIDALYNRYDGNGLTILERIAIHPDIPPRDCRQLLETIVSRDPEKYSLLERIAMFKISLEVRKKLMDEVLRYDPKALNKGGCLGSPLCFAISINKISFAYYLIQKGACIDVGTLSALTRMVEILKKNIEKKYQKAKAHSLPKASTEASEWKAKQLEMIEVFENSFKQRIK